MNGSEQWGRSSEGIAPDWQERQSESPPDTSRLLSPSTAGLNNPQLRTAYKLANGYCELEAILSRHTGEVGQMVRGMNPVSGVETNHIFSMGRRPDLWSNLIDLHPEVHRWFHANLREGRVACLWAKWKKGGRDWQVDELNLAAGKFIEGWLEGVELKDEFFDGLRQDVLSWFW